MFLANEDFFTSRETHKENIVMNNNNVLEPGPKDMQHGSEYFPASYLGYCLNLFSVQMNEKN